VTVSDQSPEASSTTKRNRIVAIVFDGVIGLVGIGAVSCVVLGLASIQLTGWGLALLALWTVVICVAALPAVAVLFFSPPRVPLKERSALVASASWFGKAVWAGAMFALSIVIGAIAGIVASTANESASKGGDGIILAIEATASLVLWPAIQTVIVVAYVVTGIRWSIDLGAIVSEDRGNSVRRLLEERWSGPLQLSPAASGLLNLTIEYGIGGISRGALVLTLITAAGSVVSAATSWYQP
jgi:hypothetical protein